MIVRFSLSVLAWSKTTERTVQLQSRMANRYKSSVWQNFERVGNAEVKCLVCEKRLKYHGSTTSPLRAHLIRMHPSTPATASSEERNARKAVGKVVLCTTSSADRLSALEEGLKSLATLCLGARGHCARCQSSPTLAWLGWFSV